MPRYETTSTIVREGGVLSGELRAAKNFSLLRFEEGNIHNEEDARRAGFKGGMVSGLIHNEQFSPLALEAFGPDWFERGFYSFYYRTPTYDGDLVRAFMRDPGTQRDNVQVEAWSETEDGQRVAEGVIGMGDPGVPSPLRARFDSSPPPGELRIMANVRAGAPLGPRDSIFPLMPGGPGTGPRNEGQITRREDTTEPLEWYFGPSPWGGPIANSLGLSRLLATGGGLVDPNYQARSEDRGIVLAGGIEVRFVNGPVFLDTEYVVSGRVLGVTESPRAENRWSEVELRDRQSGTLVATALLMNRTLKWPHPAYADTPDPRLASQDA